MARAYIDEFAPQPLGAIDLLRMFALVTMGFTRHRLRDSVVRLTGESYTVPDLTDETVITP